MPKPEQLPSNPTEAIDRLYGGVLNIAVPTGQLPNLSGEAFAGSIRDAYLTEVAPDLEDAWAAIAGACIRYGAPRAHITERRLDQGISRYNGDYSPMSTGLLVVGNPEIIRQGSQYGQTVVGMVRAYLKQGPVDYLDRSSLAETDFHKTLEELEEACNQDLNPSPAKVERVVQLLRGLNNGSSLNFGRPYFFPVVEALAGAANARPLVGQTDIATVVEARAIGYISERFFLRRFSKPMHRLNRGQRTNALRRSLDTVETRAAVCSVPVFVDPGESDSRRLSQARLPTFRDDPQFELKGETLEELQAQHDALLAGPRRQAFNARAIAALLQPGHLTPLKDISLTPQKPAQANS